ncbi:hypothetical protein ACFQ0G_47790 [Streptomyces chiangmaiensis]
MLVGIATAMHPRLRKLINALAERVEDPYELLRWPGTSKDLITAVGGEAPSGTRRAGGLLAPPT